MSGIFKAHRILLVNQGTWEPSCESVGQPGDEDDDENAPYGQPSYQMGTENTQTGLGRKSLLDDTVEARDNSAIPVDPRTKIFLQPDGQRTLQQKRSTQKCTTNLVTLYLSMLTRLNTPSTPEVGYQVGRLLTP